MFNNILIRFVLSKSESVASTVELEKKRDKVDEDEENPDHVGDDPNHRADSDRSDTRSPVKGKGKKKFVHFLCG